MNKTKVIYAPEYEAKLPFVDVLVNVEDKVISVDVVAERAVQPYARGDGETA